MYNPYNPYGQQQQQGYGYPAQGYAAQPAYGYQPGMVYEQPVYGGYPAQGYAAAPVGYAAPVAGVAMGVAPVAGMGVAVAAPVCPYPPGQSVFTQQITFQVRKNYTFEVGKGEMDIFLGGCAYYRLISNPAPSHVFGWGHNYALYDLLNNSLAYIEQEVRIGMPHFNIYVRGQRYAKLKKEFTLLNKIFHLDTETGGEHIRIKGDWFSMSFKFERTDGKVAAQVMGNYANDMYDVTIQPGEDALMILLAVLTVEKLSRDNK